MVVKMLGFNEEVGVVEMVVGMVAYNLGKTQHLVEVGFVCSKDGVTRK